MVLPASTERVRQHTEEEINEQIDREIHYRLSYYAHHPDEIDRRLRELDHEWDIERTLEANAACVALTGMCMGTTLGRKWYMMSAAALGFLLQHSMQGWCPPVTMYRRLGFRTSNEIEQERAALKVLRGDFQQIEPANGDHDNVQQRVEQAFEAVHRDRRQQQQGESAEQTSPAPEHQEH